MKSRILKSAIVLVLTAFAGVSMAGTVTGLTTFTTGTPARATEVNSNFTAVKTAVDDNNSRVAALEAQSATLNSRIAALEAKLASVSTLTHNGQPTVRFSGVNVQVVNGQNSTATANGTGNLIVGYNESDVSGRFLCTIGTNSTNFTPTTDSASCSAAGGTWTNAGFKTGSHYIVAGTQNNYSRWGGVIFGFGNTSNFNYANAVGGLYNIAGGSYATASGGNGNTAAGGYAASVSGGYGNSASGMYASVSSGYGNKAIGGYASVSGGYNNSAGASYSSVSGGSSNNAVATASAISGGIDNYAQGTASSVSGGYGCAVAIGYGWDVGNAATAGIGCSANVSQ